MKAAHSRARGGSLPPRTPVPMPAIDCDQSKLCRVVQLCRYQARVASLSSTGGQLVEHVRFKSREIATWSLQAVDQLVLSQPVDGTRSCCYGNGTTSLAFRGNSDATSRSA